ncbi:PKD domain-containing protein [Fulvivirga ulvae]|nr:PKD domain-containing protein [Fulvivirga ulvae]
MAIDDFVLSGPQTNAIPDFTRNPAGSGLCENSTITFYDNSQGSISSYSWDFGSGASPATATGRGPHEVTYATSGTKDVSLTVQGELNGAQVETKNAYISIATNTVQEKTVTAGSADLCMNEIGLVIVNDSDAGYTYQLFNATDNSPAGPKTEGNGANLELETGILLEPTTFYVEVKDLNSSCSAILSDQPEVNVLPPTFREVTLEDANICAENSINITVENSEAGVVYRIFNVTTSEVFSDDFTGNGENLVLTSYPVTDTIDIEVTGELGSCNVSFTSIKIEPRAIPESTITESGGVLAASEGESYQWYLNGKIILGANKKTYSPRELGDYTVKITSNGCSVVSEPYSATVLGLEDLLKSGDLNVFPNPTSGVLNIKQDGRFNRMTIYNLMGQVVLTKDIIFHNEVVTLSFLQPGQYILELTGKSESVKVNIQKHR